MAGLRVFNRISSLCGMAAVAAVGVVACAGPSSLGVDNGGGGKGGAGGRGGSSGPVGGTGGLAFTIPTFTLDANTAGSTGQVLSDVDGGTNCGVKTGDLTRQEADLLLVMDRSSSMAYGIASGNQCNAGDPNCTARWATVTAALDQVLTTPPDGVEWGLKFFPSPDAVNNCSVDPGADVPIPATAAMVQDAIANTKPDKQTPTKAAINEAVAYLSALNDGRAHYILLATDGQPNCDTGTSAEISPLAAANAQAAIAAAAAAGIKTYVIGIGPAPGNLENFAQAGGTGAHFPATSPDQLTAALSKIAAAVASCMFALKPLPQDPDNVVVEFNGDRNLRAPRDRSRANGWDYTSASHEGIELYGTWCDNVKNETYKSIKILMGCPNGPIP